MNLHTLASELARMDAPDGFNLDVIGAQAALDALRRKIRQSSVAESVAILMALTDGHERVEFVFESD